MKKILTTVLSLALLAIQFMVPVCAEEKPISTAEITAYDENGNVIGRQYLLLNEENSSASINGVVRYGEKTVTYTCKIGSVIYYKVSTICRYKNDDGLLTYVSHRKGNVTNLAATVSSVTAGNSSVQQDGDRDLNQPLIVTARYYLAYSYIPNGVTLPSYFDVIYRIY